MKWYPAGGTRSTAELERAVTLVHNLRCRDHLSYRQIASVLINYGLRVSLGSVWAYRNWYECPLCEHETQPGRQR